MSDLVRNREYRFSHNEAQLLQSLSGTCSINYSFDFYLVIIDKLVFDTQESMDGPGINGRPSFWFLNHVVCVKALDFYDKK